VLIYPLWMGTMPALFKAFIEQVFRPGFAMDEQRDRPWSAKLAGRSARVVITMGMPAAAYRWFFGAHSLRSLERNILKFCGIKPVRSFLVGMVDDAGGGRHQRYLDKMRGLGARGQ
ncbi:MAG: flavodoxin family protein, partial [Gammaproteobacteria bacterium]|nr:flavodoxin family protein [Gammaproteobacteria bacterium]